MGIPRVTLKLNAGCVAMQRIENRGGLRKKKKRRSLLEPVACIKFPEATNKLKMRLAEVHKCLTIPLEVASIRVRTYIYIYIKIIYSV